MDKVLSGKEVRLIITGCVFGCIRGCDRPESCGKGRATVELVTVGRDHERVPGVGLVGEEDQAHRLGQKPPAFDRGFQVPSTFANAFRSASDFALRATTDRMVDRSSRFQVLDTRP